jgi:hypothetical protein
MKLQRQAAATRTDVTARNYRHQQEVRAMNARQAKRSEQELERAKRIAGLKESDVLGALLGGD